MSTFWNFVSRLAAGTLARADDVNTIFDGIDSGLNLVEAEINKAIQVTTSPGTVDISENAAARANKLISFDSSGNIVLSTTIGNWQGDWSDAHGAYYPRDVVRDAAGTLGLNNIYICNTEYTPSGGDTIGTDSAKWDLVIDVTDIKTAKTAAETAQTAAETAQAAAETAYDNFDDRYLGAFTTAAEPTLDNDGDALITGALYFNTSLNRMKVYNGSAWQLTTAAAADVNAADAGGYFVGSDLETILQEVAPRFILERHGALAGFDSLVIQNNATNPTYQVDIDADAIELSNGSGTYVATSVNLTVDLTVSGVNGLDTGSEASATWYHLWVIYDGSTVAGLLSTSATAPTMPSGYTYKGYVGAVLNGVGGDLESIIQYGNRAYSSLEGGSTGFTTTSWTPVDLALGIPATAKAAKIQIGHNHSGAGISKITISAESTGLQGFQSFVYNGAAGTSLYEIFTPIFTAQTIWAKWATGPSTVDILSGGYWEY